MDILSFITSLPRVFAMAALDDSSVALIALLAGMGGGWLLTEARGQRKTKKVKVEREPPSSADR